MKTGKLTDYILQNVGVVLLLLVLGVFYIFNAHRTDRKLREIQSMKIESQDLHDKYMQLKQEVMYKSTASQLDKILKEKGLSRQDKPPILIPKGNGS